jgi:hypothetical protein
VKTPYRTEALPYAPLTATGLAAAAETAATSAALPYLQALTDRALHAFFGSVR